VDTLPLGDVHTDEGMEWSYEVCPRLLSIAPREGRHRHVLTSLAPRSCIRRANPPPLHRVDTKA
jgi:hypothetical protein